MTKKNFALILLPLMVMANSVTKALTLSSICHLDIPLLAVLGLSLSNIHRLWIKKANFGPLLHRICSC